MAKILLIYDDYNELTITESFMKKVGFDVIGVPSDYTLAEQLLGFNPELVIVFAKSARLNGIQVCRKIKETESFKGKVILIVMADNRPQPQDIARIRLDTLLEYPISPTRLIEVMTKVLGLSTETFLEKFSKAQYTQEDSNKIVNINSVASVKPTVGSQESSPSAGEAPFQLPSAEQNKLRSKKYSQFVTGVQFNVQESTLKSADAKKKWNELKQSWDKEHLSSLDQLKKIFTKALFSKKG